MIRRPPRSTLLPYTTLFPSTRRDRHAERLARHHRGTAPVPAPRVGGRVERLAAGLARLVGELDEEALRDARHRRLERVDRKSTRLNSSHANISYAVFCLTKK